MLAFKQANIVPKSSEWLANSSQPRLFLLCVSLMLWPSRCCCLKPLNLRLNKAGLQQQMQPPSSRHRSAPWELACVYVWRAHPVGRLLAPSCCPGASTCNTAKCLVISIMSSWLKRGLKQDLSEKKEVIIPQ